MNDYETENEWRWGLQWMSADLQRVSNEWTEEKEDTTSGSSVIQNSLQSLLEGGGGGGDSPERTTTPPATPPPYGPCSDRLISSYTPAPPPPLPQDKRQKTPVYCLMSHMCTVLLCKRHCLNNGRRFFWLRSVKAWRYLLDNVRVRVNRDKYIEKITEREYGNILYRELENELNIFFV